MSAVIGFVIPELKVNNNVVLILMSEKACKRVFVYIIGVRFSLKNVLYTCYFNRTALSKNCR